MNKAPRRMMMALWCLLVSSVLGLGTTLAHAQALRAPTGVESHPTGSGRMTLFWNATPGATSYHVYRATSSGAEGSTPHATTTSTSYVDTGLTNGPPPVYYYKVAAVNSGGVSPQSAETATPTPYPQSPGNGQVAGVPVHGGAVYYCKDALLNGFDWFVTLNGWFPQGARLFRRKYTDENRGGHGLRDHGDDAVQQRRRIEKRSIQSGFPLCVRLGTVSRSDQPRNGASGQWCRHHQYDALSADR